ncbi:hypothetical protein OG689_43960 [Kitasatospora sp. NBC_00240]|uniref:hypothetical protein n=1 Tax=Kitasatospora sp. NBC_00240 TaxID=2903567 RepID=UPI0022545736|nr:hypothetical protein [Kitasatospora sp. NBC_00240]MCX5207754.1 hypothetical protein [Kitasatospora sp. NBC_00240]MCX5215347.1 hypothetical protein [Kitasatospora sp. NBC_00240]MCX5216092.1 hypothetical protein [Kitasatospora sp. NBC_00240]
MPILTPSTTPHPVPAPALPALVPLTVILPALTGLFADRLGTPASIALIGADLAFIAAAGTLVARRKAGTTTGATGTRATDRARRDQARRDQETLDRLEPLRPTTPGSTTR